MKKIAVVALLHALVSSPAFAADEIATGLTLEIPPPPADETARLFVERLEELGRFSLLQVGDGFVMYGQLFPPRFAAGIEAPRNAGAYGLHAQFDATQDVGLHFGWDHGIAGPGGSRYTLGATIRF